MKEKSAKIQKIVMLACVSIALHFPLSTFHSLRAQYQVVHLEKPFNTPGSETGALVVGDTVLVYSSLQHNESRNTVFNIEQRIV